MTVFSGMVFMKGTATKKAKIGLALLGTGSIT